MMRKVMSIITAAFFLLVCCDSAEEEIYILPDNYIGYIVVIFNQDEGLDKKYQEGKRVYEIPPSGILKTKFGSNHGWSDFSEFYYKSSSEKIPYVYEFDKLNNEEIRVYGGSVGSANRDLEGNSVVKFAKYFIGNKEQIQKAIDDSESLNYIELADE